MELKAIRLEVPEGGNLIAGQTHFIKTVEDLYEAVVNTVPQAKFGVAFNEASGACLTRVEGNDDGLKALAQRNASAIGAGHIFVIALGGGAYPINLMNRIKDVPEVCSTDTELTILSHRFTVSQEVILRRLLALGRVSLDFYRKKRDELHKAYEREREQEEGFAPHYQVVVRDLGKQYIRIVLGAYHQEAITSSDVSDYLGTRLKHLPRIEQAAFSGVMP